MLILAFVFIFLNAFFVVAEFAIVKIRKTKLEQLAKEKVPNAKLALQIANSLDTYLSATQLGITLSSLALGWIGEPAVSKLIEEPLIKYFSLNDVAVHTISFAIAFTIITLLHVVLGELVPKSIAIAKPETSTLLIAKPLKLFWIIFSPFIKIFDFLARIMLKIFNIKPANEHDLAHSEEEIKIIVAQSQKGGILDQVETNIIKNAMDFSDTTAEQIMTPRKDMVCLNKKNTYEDNLNIVLNSKYSRFPYADGSKDNILGVVHIKEIMNDTQKDFEKIANKMLIIPENASISNVLHSMNKNHTHVALVVDEYGGTSGLITVQDIIEEIFGDMNSETDEDKPNNYKKISDNVYEFQARVDLEVVEEVMGIVFEDDLEMQTIGGYVFNLFERLPNVGDKITDEICEYEVIKMNDTSIGILKVTKKEINLDL